MADFLIRPVGDQPNGPSGFSVLMRVVGTDGTSFNFSVPYVYGLTTDEKKTAIVSAAIAKFTELRGSAPPAGSRAEVIGIG